MKIIEYNNIKYYVGENAKENWDILDQLKNINENYIWFHLNSFPSPYVIMETTILDIEDNNLWKDLLIYGAELSKNNTKYRNLKNLKICYTTLKKLNKGNKIGEVLIKGKSNIIKL